MPTPFTAFDFRIIERTGRNASRMEFDGIVTLNVPGSALDDTCIAIGARLGAGEYFEFFPAGWPVELQDASLDIARSRMDNDDAAAYLAGEGFDSYTIAVIQNFIAGDWD